MRSRVRIRFIFSSSQIFWIFALNLVCRNVICGSLQCKDGDRQPAIEGMDQLNSRTIISIKGVEYECKWVIEFETIEWTLFFFCSESTPANERIVIICRTTSGTAPSSDFTENGLVRNGTPCGTDLVCVNQTCVSIFPHIDQTKCPTNQNNIECYGQGVSKPRNAGIRWKMVQDWVSWMNCRFAPIQIGAFAIWATRDRTVRLLCPWRRPHQPNRDQHKTMKSKWKRKKRAMVSDVANRFRRLHFTLNFFLSSFNCRQK